MPSVCADDDCTIGEELPSIIVGITDNISSPNARVINIFPNLDLNIYYHFTAYLVDIYVLKKRVTESIQRIII